MVSAGTLSEGTMASCAVVVSTFDCGPPETGTGVPPGESLTSPCDKGNALLGSGSVGEDLKVGCVLGAGAAFTGFDGGSS